MKFIICLDMFRALCAHHQEVKLYYAASGIITLCRWPSRTLVDDEHIVLETCTSI